MKGKCTGLIDNVAEFYFSELPAPEVGKDYLFEDATEGTTAQRKTREALIKAYWKSGVHPTHGGDGYGIFRDHLKKDLGEGFCKFYLCGDYQRKAKDFHRKEKGRNPPAYLG